MKYILLSWLIILSLIFISCKGNSENRTTGNKYPVSGVIRWEDISDCYFDQFVDSVVYIPLESHPSGLFRVVDKAVVSGEKIFIFDYHARNQVLVYNTAGEFLYQVGNRGRGPGEYIQMRNFTVDEQYVYVLDNNTHRLLLYDINDGRYVTYKHMPFWATDVACFETGDFVFSQDLSPIDVTDSTRQSRILITDDKLEIKNRLFPFTSEDCSVEHITSFRQGDEISFHTLIVDTAALFQKACPDSVPHVLRFEFGSMTIPAQHRSHWQACQDYAYVASPPIVTPKYIVGEVQERENTYSYLYHRANGKTYKGYNAGNDFISVLCCDEDGNLYTDFQVSEVYYYMVEHGWPRASETIEQRIENGDYVLIKLIMK